MINDTSTLVYQNYNYDNVFNRSVIGGLLFLLNHKLTYEQVWDDKTTETVTVPFAYNFAHAKDQRFAQDNYTFFGRECFSDKFIDGKFDMCPRFAVTYTGSQIEASNITNRFVKGTYMENKDGKLTSYTAFMYSIPLNLSFEIEGWIDTLETAFKIEQSIRDTFYKNQRFDVLYRGMKVGCRVGFPESMTVGEKTITYGFEQDSQLIKMTFSLAVEAYQPCFDESQSIKSDNKIERFGIDPTVYNNNLTPTNKQVYIKFKDFDNTISYVTGQTITLNWASSCANSDVYSVNLYYKTIDGEKHFIKNIVRQHGTYDWTIQQSISEFVQPTIVFFENDLEIIEEPHVAVNPSRDGYVNTGDFIITNPGKFTGTGYVQVSCEYIDASSNVNIHDCYVAYVDGNEGVKEISYYKDVPEVSFEISNTKKLKYKKGSFGTYITIGIEYALDDKIKDEIHNVMII